MKSVIRSYLFTLISINVTQYIMDAFVFGGSYVGTFFLVSLALFLLYFFIKPLLKIVGLPSKGVGFLFLLFVLSLVILRALILFLPSFDIRETTLSGLIIFGFVLPSKSLTGLWASVFSALVLSAVYTFFDWLCSKK